MWEEMADDEDVGVVSNELIRRPASAQDCGVMQDMDDSVQLL